MKKTKNPIKNYISYLQDNPKNYWFKARLYGWGWAPAKWQGWVVILMYLAFVFWEANKLQGLEQAQQEELPVGYFVKILIATSILIAIAYQKGEKPRWQWGSKK